MRCIYINLNSAFKRKQAFEENFAQFRLQNWRLTRLEAYDTGHVENNKISGSLLASEKACFLSHVNAIRTSLDDDNHVHILEDDAVFGRQSCADIEMALKRLHSTDWDIFYTDIGTSDIFTMAHFIHLAQAVPDGKKFNIFNIFNVNHWGANSYIINARSKQKILKLLEKIKRLDLPYDLVLKHFSDKKLLKSFFACPFLMTVSNHSFSSSVQPQHKTILDYYSNLFRQMMWLDADYDDISSKLDVNENHRNTVARQFASIQCGIAEFYLQLRYEHGLPKQLDTI
jgi:GR25 family glycosyltransferase involved in LPS biosynthesis